MLVTKFQGAKVTASYWNFCSWEWIGPGAIRLCFVIHTYTILWICIYIYLCKYW